MTIMTISSNNFQSQLGTPTQQPNMNMIVWTGVAQDFVHRCGLLLPFRFEVSPTVVFFVETTKVFTQQMVNCWAQWPTSRPWIFWCLNRGKVVGGGFLTYQQVVLLGVPIWFIAFFFVYSRWWGVCGWSGWWMMKDKMRNEEWWRIEN